jgi:hypothetical protein
MHSLPKYERNRLAHRPMLAVEALAAAVAEMEMEALRACSFGT